MLRRLLLPRPLRHQVDILLDPHRHKVACCGRRFGKTLFGMIAVLDGHGPLVTGADGVARPKFRGALHGATIWWVSSSFPVAKKIWRDVKKALRKWGGELQKSEQDWRIDFPGGGSLTVKSAHDPNSLVGDGIHGIVFDEAALASEEAWSVSLRPTLADYEGWSILISTPKGKNWFYKQWLIGADGMDPDYASWRRPTSDNPTLSPAEIDAMRREMGPYAFAMQCEADFETTEGGIVMFRREWFSFHTENDTHLVPDKGEPVAKRDLYVFMTADLAYTTRDWSDFTVVMTWGRAPDGRLFVLDMVRGKFEVPQIVPVLRRTFDRWGARVLWLEASGPLVRLNKEAADAGIPVKEYKVHAEPGKNDKVSRAQPCAAAVESGRVTLAKVKHASGAWVPAPWCADLIAEAAAFPSPQEHDDAVDALALGVLVAPPSRPPALAGAGHTYARRRERDEDDERPRGGWLIGRD